MTRCFNNKTKCTRVYHLTPDSKIECTGCLRKRTSLAGYVKSGKVEAFVPFISPLDRYPIHYVPHVAEPYRPRRGSSRSALARITNTLRCLEIGEGFIIDKSMITKIKSANSRIGIKIIYVVNPTDLHIYAKRTS